MRSANHSNLKRLAPAWRSEFRNRASEITIIVLTWCVFAQVVSFDFINIDDNIYVTENAYVQNGLTWDSISWALTSTEIAGFWQPAVWLSLMLDRSLWGDWAGGFHLTNLLLHTACSLMIFWWLKSLTGASLRSFLAAVIFAIHPLHVESVAWVTERKDVLSTCFAVASLICWTRYKQGETPRWFAAAWVAMAFSLMAKQMFVTLPFVFLLLDYWPLRLKSSAARTGLKKSAVPPGRSRFLVEKLPFFALSLLMSLVVFMTQSNVGATELLEDVSLPYRVGNAVNVYTLYLQKFFWPTQLAVFYPHPGLNISGADIAWSGSILTGITVAALVLRHRLPSLVFGWAWFLGTLLPVIGIVQVGYQQMADRFMYFPMLGLLIGIMWSTPHRDSRRTPFTLVVCCLLAGVAAFGAFNQTTHWKNSVALCHHGLTATQPNWFLSASLGAAVMVHPNDAEHLLSPRFPRAVDLAEKHLRDAIRLQPNYAPAYFNLGLAIADQGDLQGSNQQFRQALSLQPDYDKARYFLCINLKRLGETQELQKQMRILKESGPAR